MVSPEEQRERLDGRVHGWFSLSYANYLVVPRALLQSMPVVWQERFVDCMDELDDAFSHLKAVGYNVQTGEWIPVSECSERQRGLAGATVDAEPDPDGNLVYYDRDTNQIQGWQRVFVPDADPNPHYNRGRTFIEPRSET